MHGLMRIDGQRLTIEFRLYDLTNPEFRLIASKMFWVEPLSDHRRLAHRIADEVVYQFTGERGIAETKIAYVSHQGPNKEIVMIDYGYEMPVPLAAGTRTLRVVNPSPQPHEVIIARLKDGMTLEDVRAWEEAGAGNGSSPWIAMGGVGDVAAGDTLYMTRDFPRGTYRLACFYVTPGAKENHARLGMKTYIEVN